MNKLKNLCVPLMSRDVMRNQLFGCFATATIANVDDSFFLVSAAHSFVGLNTNPLYIHKHLAPINLANHVIVTNENTDIAATKLGVEITDQLAEEIYFVNSTLLDAVLRAQDVREFTATKLSSDHSTMVSGFPWNRNRVKTRHDAIGEEGLNIEAFDISDKIFGDNRSRKIVEVALYYDEKNGHDDNGCRIHPRKLEGMSGGPITEQFRTNNAGFLRMQGIFLRHDRTNRALFGVRYSYILKWLAANAWRFSGSPV